MFRRLCLACVLLAGCLPPPSPTTAPPTKAAPGTVPGTHTGGPITEEEKEVAGRIIPHLHDPASLEWVEWGPHDLTGETHFKDPAKYKLIRVRWRNRPKDSPVVTHDAIYAIDATVKEQGIGSINTDGPHWLEVHRQFKRATEEGSRRGEPAYPRWPGQ